MTVPYQCRDGGLRHTLSSMGFAFRGGVNRVCFLGLVTHSVVTHVPTEDQHHLEDSKKASPQLWIHNFVALNTLYFISHIPT